MKTAIMDELRKTELEDRGDEQRHAEVLPPVKARQGLISGRVLMVLAASVIILSLIYACMWFFSARL